MADKVEEVKEKAPAKKTEKVVPKKKVEVEAAPVLSKKAEVVVPTPEPKKVKSKRKSGWRASNRRRN